MSRTSTKSGGRSLSAAQRSGDATSLERELIARKRDEIDGLSESARIGIVRQRCRRLVEKYELELSREEFDDYCDETTAQCWVKFLNLPRYSDTRRVRLFGFWSKVRVPRFEMTALHRYSIAVMQSAHEACPRSKRGRKFASTRPRRSRYRDVSSAAHRVDVEPADVGGSYSIDRRLEDSEQIAAVIAALPEKLRLTAECAIAGIDQATSAQLQDCTVRTIQNRYAQLREALGGCVELFGCALPVELRRAPVAPSVVAALPKRLLSPLPAWFASRPRASWNSPETGYPMADDSLSAGLDRWLGIQRDTTAGVRCNVDVGSAPAAKAPLRPAGRYHPEPRRLADVTIASSPSGTIGAIGRPIDPSGVSISELCNSRMSAEIARRKLLSVK